jgi:hypothetical protein
MKLWWWPGDIDVDGCAHSWKRDEAILEYLDRINKAKPLIPNVKCR